MQRRRGCAEAQLNASRVQCSPVVCVPIYPSPGTWGAYIHLAAAGILEQGAGDNEQPQPKSFARPRSPSPVPTSWHATMFSVREDAHQGHRDLGLLQQPHTDVQTAAGGSYRLRKGRVASLARVVQEARAPGHHRVCLVLPTAACGKFMDLCTSLHAGRGAAGAVGRGGLP